MASITIIGPGAVGSALAAHLSTVSGHDVTVAARTPFDRIELITYDTVLHATPRIVTDPADLSPADWVLVTTKTYDAAATAGWFASGVNSQTTVAVLQNGVEHVARFSPWLDTEQLLPVVVDLPAQRMAPGLVTQRGVARLTVAGEQGASFAALFASTAVEVSQVPELTTAMWAKLCVNVAGAVSAATLTSGMVYHDGAVADLVEAIVAECVAVGRAEGAELDDDLARRVADGYRTSPADDITSLHADRLAGRPMEIDARNGAVVRFGERHGIATPLNAALVAILRAAEAQ